VQAPERKDDALTWAMIATGVVILGGGGLILAKRKKARR
jgi:LPXTG-motif cell wall-anchored protein